MSIYIGGSRCKAVHAAVLTALAFALVSPCALTQQDPDSASQEDTNRRFDIWAYRAEGNSLLSSAAIDSAVYPFLGPKRTYEDVEAARAALEKAYQALGYMTVAVTIPEQTVTDTIQLEVIEQKVGKLVVTGTSSARAAEIRRAAESMSEGTILSFKQVEADIVALNRTADRRVTPNLVAGEPGTIDVELNVEERVALHVSSELNNRGTSNTTDLRASASIGYHDIWGRGDMLTLSAQTAPDRRKDGEVYSASILGWLPGHRSQLLAYAVKSESDIAVIGAIGSGTLNVFGRGNLYGLRWLKPLPSQEGLFHSLSFGIERKDFEEILRLDEEGCLPTEETSGPVEEIENADQFCSTPIDYFPVSLKYQVTWPITPIRSELVLTSTFGTRALGDDREAFDAKRVGARPSFFHLRLDASNTARLPADWQLFAQWRGQYAGRPLISNEQFSIGGLDTVRGYYESESLGDYGGSVQVELRTPSFHAWASDVIDQLRIHAFADYGVVRNHETLIEESGGDSLLGVGLGLRLQVFDYLFGSVDFARALRPGSATIDTDAVNAFFRVWGEF